MSFASSRESLPRHERAGQRARHARALSRCASTGSFGTHPSDLTGEVVLTELERVLTSKFKMPPDIVRDDVVGPLRDHHVEPRPQTTGSLTVRDPDDAWVLASALAAKTEVLVTGDPDLLVLADSIPQLHITNPRFLGLAPAPVMPALSHRLHE